VLVESLTGPHTEGESKPTCSARTAWRMISLGPNPSEASLYPICMIPSLVNLFPTHLPAGLRAETG
jgi:hypothetical protein